MWREYLQHIVQSARTTLRSLEQLMNGVRDIAFSQRLWKGDEALMF